MGGRLAQSQPVDGRGRQRLTRRELFQAAASVALAASSAACTGEADPPSAPAVTPSPSRVAESERQATIRVVAAEQALLAWYDELLAQRLAAPARALAHTLRAGHAEHVRVLGHRLITDSAATPEGDRASPVDWVELGRAERSAAGTATLALEVVGASAARRLARVAADDLAYGARVELGPAQAATATQLARDTAALPAPPERALSHGSPVRRALVDIVAGEHAAVWGLQVVAARAHSGEPRTLGLACLAAHEAARDAAVRWVRTAGGRPPLPAPGYALPPHLQPPSAFRQLAVLLEQRTGRQWEGLVELVDGQDRRLPAQALAGTAIRQVAWTGRAPGEPE